MAGLVAEKRKPDLTARSYTFSHALVRKPGRSIVDGLRSEDIGEPNLNRFEKHHKTYVAALRKTGAKVTVLDPLESFPDSVFIEDAALCLPEGAVAMRPGAPSRLGEADIIEPILVDFYDEVERIEGPGFIEGGDILTTEREILVGRSERTDADGIAELGKLVGQWGYTVREVITPQGVLHFKTDCSLLDEETILSTQRLASSGCFKNYKVIQTVEGEEAIANSIRFNDLLMVPNGFPKTTEVLVNAGYNVRVMPNSEAAKLDGGLSCLSLRFSPPADFLT